MEDRSQGIHSHGKKILCDKWKVLLTSTKTLPNMFCSNTRTLSNKSDNHATGTSNTFKTFHQLFHIPKVYAEELTQSVEETSMDKLLNSKPKISVSDDEIQAYLSKETGRDRLNAMFAKTNFSNGSSLSPELEFVITSTVTCSFISFFIFAVSGTRAAKDKFIESNAHKKFTTKFRAVRAYNDALIIGGFKRGGYMAMKTGAFASVFLMSSQCIAVYRNKSSPWEYMAGGAITGAILRMNMGLKGMFAGGIISGALGLVGGSLMVLAMYSGNETQEQRHHFQIEQKMRDKKAAKLLADSAFEQDNEEENSQMASA